MIEVNEIQPLPSPEFCKKLHEYDSELALNWDPNHKFWSIWHKSSKDGSMNHVMNVVDEKGEPAPLDGRVFLILDRNAYYAKNPEELIRKVVDSVPEEIARQEKTVKDDLRHLSKDKFLLREWDRTIDKLKSVNWKEWTKSKTLKNPNTGKTLLGADGKPIWYKPHDSISHDKRKPVL